MPIAREDEIGCLPVGDADHDRAETADLMLRRDWAAVPRMRLAGAAVVYQAGVHRSTAPFLLADSDCLLRQCWPRSPRRDAPMRPMARSISCRNSAST